MDPAGYLPQLGLQDVSPDSDGVIRVDRSALSGDPGTFPVDWGASWSLHEDSNENDQVDPDEPDLSAAPCPRDLNHDSRSLSR